MKCFLIILFAITVACSSRQQGVEAQSKTDYKETHGGDEVSLYFIKSARAVQKLIVENPNSELAQVINPKDFLNAIERTDIVSEEKSLHANENQVTLDRQYWLTEINCRNLLTQVVRGYGKKLNLTLGDPDIKYLITKIPSWNEACLLPLGVYERREPYLRLLREARQEEIKYLGEFLVDALKTYLPSAETLAFNSWLNTNPYFLDNLMVSVVKGPIELNGQIKDAINIQADGSYKVIFNSTTWKMLSDGELIELLWHELSPFAKYHDEHYQESSKLFLSLPKEFYGLSANIITISKSAGPGPEAIMKGINCTPYQKSIEFFRKFYCK